MGGRANCDSSRDAQLILTGITHSPSCYPSAMPPPIPSSHRARHTRARQEGPLVLPANPGVCIFSPSPLFTVTIEEGAGTEPEVHFHAGGQGVWVGRMTTLLGAPTRLCGAFGGESGAILSLLLDAEGIRVRSVQGSSANGGYIHDRRTGEREVVVSTECPTLSRHELDDLYNLTVAESMASGVLILTGNTRDGVVPADTYGRLSHDLGKNDILVVADISGDDLRSLETGVHVLKVSHDDLFRDGFVSTRDDDDLIECMQKFRKVAKNIVISRAGDPAWALLDDKLVSIHPPTFEPLDHRGAGDSMTAAISAGLARDLDIRDCLKLGAAAGALNVTRHGLGSGRRESVETIARQVAVRAVRRPTASKAAATKKAAPARKKVTA